MLEEAVIAALASKYAKSSGQIVLRWLFQLGALPLPKSRHSVRQQDNLNIFDFALDEEDMMEIMELDNGETLFFNHQNPEVVERFDDIS